MTNHQLASIKAGESQRYHARLLSNDFDSTKAKYTLVVEDSHKHTPPKLWGLIPGRNATVTHNLTKKIRDESEGSMPDKLGIIIHSREAPPTASVEITYKNGSKSTFNTLKLP